jgi:adenylate cyclase
LFEFYLDRLNSKSISLFSNNDTVDSIKLDDKDIIVLKIISSDDLHRELLYFNGKEDRLFLTNILNLKIRQFENFRNQIQNGQIFVSNISSDTNSLTFLLGTALSFNNVKGEHPIAWAIIKTDRLLKILRTNDSRGFYLFDSLGNTFASSDEKILITKTLNIILAKASRDFHAKIQQKYISDEGLKKWLVTGVQTNLGTYLFSQTPSETILAPAKYMKENSYFLLGIVLSCSILILFFFSEHISKPIEKLSELSVSIGKGDLNVEASKHINSSDEVGDLARSFDLMVNGLRERQKMFTVLNKFHGSAVTEELLTNEVIRRGETKDVTIFFSDIRGFTDFSEGHTPEEVVQMLNEYFEVMVEIINRNHGVVDKFIGDAIMAVWGVPHPHPEDSRRAITACLEMRLALEKLNEKRIDQKLLPIKIGIGLHAGSVVSGTVGSSERMEYTVIGDNVNTASRIEASTKSFGTDLLISQEVKMRGEGKFLFEVAGKVMVQGKSEALILNFVTGTINEDGSANIIETAYSKYEASADKKVKNIS